MFVLPITVNRRALLVLSAVLQVALASRGFSQAGLPSPTSMNAILDSLERVALTSTEAEVRARAVMTITGAGRLWTAAPGAGNMPPRVRYPGIVARLARVYRQSNNASLRAMIVYWMPALDERAEAAGLLAEAAAQEPERVPPAPSGIAVVGNDATFPLPYLAITALTAMGEEGRATLAWLHAQGSVRETMARVYLDTLANHGFAPPRGQ